MKETIRQELTQYVVDLYADKVLTERKREEWHYLAFNEDYYIIGYHQCSEWLKKHDLDPYEAIAICQDYEEEVFGEFKTRYDNAEVTVNMLAYIYGEEIVNELMSWSDSIDEYVANNFTKDINN